MIAICVRPEIRREVEQLNFKGSFPLQILTLGAFSGVQAVQQQLEGGDYTHLFFDLDVFPNCDLGIELLTRLADSRPQMKVLVLAEGLGGNNSIVKDLIESAKLQPGQVFYETGAPMLAWINSTFVQDGVLLPEPKTEQEPPGPVREEAETAPLAPNRLNTREARHAAREEPPVIRSAITVAVAGAGHRIGCTTQAMQLLHFLRIQGYRVALIALQKNCCLADYYDVFPDSEVEGDHLLINGIHLYLGAKSIVTAKNRYEYLILDYGALEDLSDLASYVDKDIRVVVCGCKPHETDAIRTAFSLGDPHLKYVFSFVAKSDWEGILAQMQAGSSNTWFAPWQPDYYTYSGDDGLYREILAPEKAPSREDEAPAKFGLRLFNGKRKKKRM